MKIILITILVIVHISIASQQQNESVELNPEIMEKIVSNLKKLQIEQNQLNVLTKNQTTDLKSKMKELENSSLDSEQRMAIEAEVLKLKMEQLSMKEEKLSAIANIFQNMYNEYQKIPKKDRVKKIELHNSIKEQLSYYQTSINSLETYDSDKKRLEQLLQTVDRGSNSPNFERINEGYKNILVQIQIMHQRQNKIKRYAQIGVINILQLEMEKINIDFNDEDESFDQYFEERYGG